MKTIIAAAVAAFCFASTAHAQAPLVPFKTTLPHKHPTMSLLGASKPISDAQAACLKPVNSALFTGLYLLTKLKPGGTDNPAKPDPRFKPTETLVAELRALVETTDWAERPPPALRAERAEALARQKVAHEALVLVVLARGENLAAGMKVQERMADLGKPGGEPESVRAELENLSKRLDEIVDKLDDETLKQAANVNVIDATVKYYDCELASSSSPGK
jgi:hypothetical protein